MRSPPSAREIGVRKVAGASRIQVIGQHLAESIGITGIAFLLAVVLAVLSLPILNGVTDKSIELAFLMQMPVLLALAGFALLIGLVGGSPPALVLTAFSAAETLKNPWDGKRGRRFRSVLVVGGHDVVTVGALGLGTSEDVKLIRTAEENGRIFLTRDRDFGGLVFVEGVRTGVVYLRILPSTQDLVHAELERVLALYPEPHLLESFVVVEPLRHRIRRLARGH